MSRVRSADDDPPTRFPVASTVFLPSPRRIRRGLNALLSAPRLAVELRRTADDKQKGKTKMRNLDEETDEFREFARQDGHDTETARRSNYIKKLFEGEPGTGAMSAVVSSSLAASSSSSAAASAASSGPS